jgi:hypothetical protein
VAEIDDANAGGEVEQLNALVGGYEGALAILEDVPGESADASGDVLLAEGGGVEVAVCSGGGHGCCELTEGLHSGGIEMSWDGAAGSLHGGYSLYHLSGLGLVARHADRQTLSSRRRHTTCWECWGVDEGLCPSAPLPLCPSAPNGESTPAY